MFPTVWCPKCGLQLQGQSPTGTKAQVFEHPFAGSAMTGGKACELKGKKFRPPTVLLEVVD